VTVRGGAKRRPVVLYQPRDEGWVMPLSLLALGSWLAGEHVVIVDGRFELAPEARIVELARVALCLGVTVRTGAPLREALRVSAAARATNPDLTIVWGGAHATLDPASCLATGTVDACALGAGEEPMTGAVEDLRAGRRLRPGAGLAVEPEHAGRREAVPAPATLWPRAEYSLLDVERHFEHRGARRLDYCSSRGARDGSTWMAIRAERVVAEAAQLGERYRLSEILFHDEDFFGDPARVDEIAQGLAEGGERLGWQAGARPQDVLACGPERLRLLAQSGCRRLHLGVAPGAPPRELLMEAGSRLHEARLRARFVFEVAQPDGRFDGLEAAVGVARSLCALDGGFETSIRRVWAPPADSPEGLLLEGWARHAEAPWPDARAERRLSRATFFFSEAQRDPGRRLGKHLVRLLALVRVRLGFFALDFDRLVVEVSAILRTGRPRRVTRAD
jgi:anaerobic magnesium-protoporphyrin IX monomethyl ester cyclase